MRLVRCEATTQLRYGDVQRGFVGCNFCEDRTGFGARQPLVVSKLATGSHLLAAAKWGFSRGRKRIRDTLKCRLQGVARGSTANKLAVAPKFKTRLTSMASKPLIIATLIGASVGV